MDLSSAAAPLGERLKAAGQSVAVAESSTGGLIAASLLAVPGASAYFQGGTVIYTRRSRHALLQIDKDVVADLDPGLEPLAGHFATRVREILDATWGIGELGIAGPTGSPYGHEAGTSAIAVSGPITRAITIETGSANRAENMQRFTEAAIRLLGDVLEEAGRGSGADGTLSG